MRVTVHGKPVDLSPETILATRQWFADNDRECIREAVEGVTPVRDLTAYIAWREESAALTMAGSSDHTFAFLQRAVEIQTGECVPLLS